MARGGKVLNNGRNKHEQFVPLPYSMLKSEAWLSLNPKAIKVYLELRSRFYGSNNGELSLSYADAQSRLHLGRSAIKAAFDELEEKGFIELMVLGHWYGRKATEWRVTDCRCKDKPPTNDWRKWTPGESFKKTEVGPDTEHIHYLTVPSEDRRVKICPA